MLSCVYGMAAQPVAHMLRTDMHAAHVQDAQHFAVYLCICLLLLCKSTAQSRTSIAVILASSKQSLAGMNMCTRSCSTVVFAHSAMAASWVLTYGTGGCRG